MKAGEQVKALSFKGGVHPLHKEHEGKPLTQNSPIKEHVAQTVAIPMQQNIGAPCKPIVKKGDVVDMGQMVGDPTGFVGAPVHASVSGTVIAVEPRPHVTGMPVTCVVIENDFEDRLHESVKPRGTVESLSAEEIRKAVLEAGIVGMGGATFPTHVKLAVKEPTKIDYLILNGAECEPYLTTDYRMMLENPEKIIIGALALAKSVSAQRTIIGIETNKPEAIAVMQKAAEGKQVEIAVLQTKYPQGGEKQLIKAVTGISVPMGALPSSVGALVDNVTTAAAVYDIIYNGLPLIKRNLTVTGDVNEPCNLLVRIGTTFQEAIDQAQGFKGDPRKIISGGPMMGFTTSRTDVSITKGTSGITIFNTINEKHTIEGNCMRCGRCVEVCPMGLLPQALNAAYNKQMIEKCEQLNAMNCINCGCCTYICPAQRHISQSIDLSKRAIAAKNRR